MKILIVSHYFPPHVGGIEFVAQNQAKHLANAGHTISVLTSAIDAPKGVQKHADGYTIVRITANNSLQKFGVPFPFFSPALFIQSFKSVWAADIVHVHDAFYLSSLAATFWAWILRKPVVLNQHVAIVPHPNKIINLIQKIIYGTSGKFIFWNSNRIIIINSNVKDFLLSHHVDAEKLILIPNGVDTKLYHPAISTDKTNLRKKYNLPISTQLAVFVGRFVPKKGFDTLLKAGSNNYKIVFVGGIAPKKYASDERFIFLGSRSPEEVAEIYRACDMFVLPSHGEGFPLSIQEAMASGLPIIAGEDKGYDIYGFDLTRMHFIHPTASEVKKYLMAICDDKKQAKAMKDYSVEYARNNFDWNTTTKHILKLYRELLS